MLLSRNRTLVSEAQQLGAGGNAQWGNLTYPGAVADLLNQLGRLHRPIQAAPSHSEQFSHPNFSGIPAAMMHKAILPVRYGGCYVGQQNGRRFLPCSDGNRD